jgi:hypothetical protein
MRRSTVKSLRESDAIFLKDNIGLISRNAGSKKLKVLCSMGFSPDSKFILREKG